VIQRLDVGKIPYNKPLTGRTELKIDVLGACRYGGYDHADKLLGGGSGTLVAKEDTGNKTPVAAEFSSQEDDILFEDIAEDEAAPSKRANRFSIPKIPLFFMGLGVYRAWIEIVYINPVINYPTQVVAGHDLFDWTMIVGLLLMVAFAKRLTPLYRKTWAIALMVVLLLASTAINFVSLWFPDLMQPLAYPACIAGGLGIAIMILLWSEYYGTLNPLRVTMYYSGSIVLGALIIYVYRGFYTPWMFVGTMLLPVISLLCLFSCYKNTESASLPRAVWGSFTFPWKPVLVMAVYAFAYGMRETQAYSLFGPHSALGTCVVGIVIFLAVVWRGDRFDLTIIYRIALPAMVIGFLVLSFLGSYGTWISDFCVTGSYTAFTILIMIICANLCYRYGASAVFIFGIERALRSIFMFSGRETTKFINTTVLPSETQQFMIICAVVIALVVCTMLLLSEKDISSNWGMIFRESARSNSPEVASQNRIGQRCTQMAKEWNLSHREEEVLLLLAQHKSVGVIERELYIANGTAKAHVRHIYRKADVHSREELLTKLGVE